MSGFGGRWGFAGGWAIDLFLGRQSRPHADVDIAVLRDDQTALRPLLLGADVRKVVAHELAAWPDDETLQSPVHEVHVTWPDDFHLEFLLNEHDERTQEWVFRRETRIRRSLHAAFLGEAGRWYLAPEIVLLYKSKAPRSNDDADFEAAVPHLRADQRAWLIEALAVTAPSHRWAQSLGR